MCCLPLQGSRAHLFILAEPDPRRTLLLLLSLFSAPPVQPAAGGRDAAVLHSAAGRGAAVRLERRGVWAARRGRRPGGARPGAAGGRTVTIGAKTALFDNLTMKHPWFTERSADHAISSCRLCHFVGADGRAPCLPAGLAAGGASGGHAAPAAALADPGRCCCGCRPLVGRPPASQRRRGAAAVRLPRAAGGGRGAPRRGL